MDSMPGLFPTDFDDGTCLSVDLSVGHPQPNDDGVPQCASGKEDPRSDKRGLLLFLHQSEKPIPCEARTDLKMPCYVQSSSYRRRRRFVGVV